MRIRILIHISQVTAVVIIALLTSFCTRNTGETVISPPATQPLSRSVVGYGVVNASYILVLADPEQADASLGYLRRGAVVSILERRSINTRGNIESWVLVEGNYRGWLKETVVDIYTHKAQAETASENMLQ